MGVVIRATGDCCGVGYGCTDWRGLGCTSAVGVSPRVAGLPSCEGMNCTGAAAAAGGHVPAGAPLWLGCCCCWRALHQKVAR